MTTIESGASERMPRDMAAMPIERFGNLTELALGSIRQIFDSMPATRESLALLFAIDAAQTSPTEEWIGFFVETACAQIIWDDRPSGTLTGADARWVLARFDEEPRLSVLALLVRMAEEALRIPVDYVAEVRRRGTAFTDGAAAASPSRKLPVPYLRLVA